MEGAFPIPTDVSKLWQRIPDKNAFRGFRIVMNQSEYERLEVECDDNVKIAREWRAMAEADGWEFVPTYDNHEPVESAFKSTRDGFTIRGLARPTTEKYLGSGEISMWGPDGMSIIVPLIYPGMEYFRDAIKFCKHCGAKDVETFLYSFAGRCCANCLPEMRRIHEQPGWCD